MGLNSDEGARLGDSRKKGLQGEKSPGKRVSKVRLSEQENLDTFCMFHLYLIIL